MGGIANAVGGLFQSTASAFTPQNSYQSNVGGQNLNALLTGAQGDISQDRTNQNGLAQQLLAQSQGQGVNPSQIQLEQALNQNQQNQAGAVASQKGINPGLAQKQIMDNGANMAQKEAGQGALMGAQQQLAAQNQLGSLYGNMANQSLSKQGQYEGVLNAQNGVNAATSAQNAAANQNTVGGLIGGAGSAMMFMADGGEVPHLSSGGYGAAQTNATPNTQNYLGMDVGAPAPEGFGYGISSGMTSLDGSASSPQTLSDSLSSWGSGLSTGMDPLSGDGGQGNGMKAAGTMMKGLGGGGNGASDAIASQLAQQSGMPHWSAGNGKKSGGIDPSQIASMAAMFAAHGGQVGGQAPVRGDSPKNDIVPAVLSAKEIVLPRSVTMSDDPGEAAKSFVEQLKGQSKKKDSSYAKVLAAKRMAQ